MRFACAIALCVVALTLIASYAPATIISSQATSASNPSAFTPSSTDLANAGQPTFLSITGQGHDWYTGAPSTAAYVTAGVVDGTLAGTSPYPDWYNHGDGSFMPYYSNYDGGAWYCITLNTSVNTNGYNITEIQSIAAGASTWTNMAYTVAWAAPGSSVYTTLISVSYTGSADAREVTIEDGTNPGVTPIATGVGSLMFTFPTDPGFLTLRETDVFGVPTQTPEPGTLALLVAGLAGLLCYAWRKRR